MKGGSHRSQSCTEILPIGKNSVLTSLALSASMAHAADTAAPPSPFDRVVKRCSVVAQSIVHGCVVGDKMSGANC
jgi:hypothetical protein